MHVTSKGGKREQNGAVSELEYTPAKYTIVEIKGKLGVGFFLVTRLGLPIGLSG